MIKATEIDISFDQKKPDTHLQNRIAEVVKQKFLPELEILFDQKAAGNNLIRIDTLDIELETIAVENWEDAFVKAAIRKIRQKLDAISTFSSPEEVYEISYRANEAVIEKETILNDDIKTLIYFIQHGVLTWNIAPSQANDWFLFLTQKLINSHLKVSVKQSVWQSIFFSANTFRRFITQLPKELVTAFVQNGVSRGTQGYDSVKEISFILQGNPLKPDDTILKHVVWFLQPQFQVDENAVKRMVNEAFTSTQIMQLHQFLNQTSNLQLIPLRQLIASLPPIANDTCTAQEAEIEKRTNSPIEQARIETSMDPSHYIENAGLVILHPFLKPLFNNLQYLTKDQFANMTLQARAVLLTQYLVTEKPVMPEYDLLLNKILCGYIPGYTLEKELELTREEQTEAADLIKSVIKHWSALKNTGIDGLRDTFLQRPGKLTSLPGHWLLQVEQKSFDVLMNYLPWGISFIQLPWMNKRIIVEWNS